MAFYLDIAGKCVSTPRLFGTLKLIHIPRYASEARFIVFGAVFGDWGDINRSLESYKLHMERN